MVKSKERAKITRESLKLWLQEQRSRSHSEDSRGKRCPSNIYQTTYGVVPVETVLVEQRQIYEEYGTEMTGIGGLYKIEKEI